jgi:hypothetical protein
MAFAGCSSWKDFVARTGHAGAKPSGLVLAAVFPSDDRDAGEMVWTEDGTVRWLFLPREGEPDDARQRTPIDVAEHLATRVLDKLADSARRGAPV